MDSFDEYNIMQTAESGQHYYHPVEMGLIGMFLGHKLSLTRFGQWFETSPVIGFIYWLITRIVKWGFIACCLYILGYVIFV